MRAKLAIFNTLLTVSDGLKVEVSVDSYLWLEFCHIDRISNGVRRGGRNAVGNRRDKGVGGGDGGSVQKNFEVSTLAQSNTAKRDRLAMILDQRQDTKELS